MNSIVRNMIGLCIAMASVSSTAMALDAKVYSGQTCVPAANTAAYSILSNGGIYNPSTTAALTVYCPIIKDVTADTSINSYSVAVSDRNTSDGVKCTLFSRTQDTTREGLSVATGNSDSIVTTLTSGSQTVLEDGALFLKCSIPKVGADLSGIVFYRLTEIN